MFWQMGEQVRSILLGTAGLTVAALVSLFLTLSRGAIHANKTRLLATVRLAALAILLQAAHFAEELATHFDQRFPELLRLMPWPHLFFVAFNVFWLMMWTLSMWGLSAGRRLALFPLWFLGLAGVANGIAHPFFAALTGGYFPGLLTAPFVGVVGFLLVRRLFSITDERRSTAAAV
jgi:uncharacterized protein with HXXEE motif